MLAEVAAVGAVPFVVLLDQDVPGEAQQRGRVRERADDVGADVSVAACLREAKAGVGWSPEMSTAWPPLRSSSLVTIDPSRRSCWRAAAFVRDSDCERIA